MSDITKTFKRNQIIISLHGIKTRGAWQKNLASKLNGMKYYPLDYGNFLAIQLIFPFLRTSKYHWFRKEYNRIVAENDGAIPSIIAHSFGTLILANAMVKFPDLKFDKIILAGSIVKRNFNFTEKYKSNSYTRLLNIVCKKDRWAKIASLICGTGSSGVTNFANEKSIETLEYPEMGHSDMLEDDVFNTRIVPFLLQFSYYKDGTEPHKLIDRICPYNAAYWSALTYNKQFIERFKMAKASGEFKNKNNKLISPPDKLIILIPSHYSEASHTERLNTFINMENITFELKNGEKRSVVGSSENIMYDIPTIIDTAEIFNHAYGEETAMEFIKCFSESLRHLTKECSYIEIQDLSKFKKTTKK